MNCTLSKVFLFAVGAAFGSAVTWKLLKTKYERIAQEEIDSVKEVFSKRAKEEKVEVVEEPVSEEKEHREEYVDTLNKLNYAAEEVTFMADPYVISPEEFGELGDDYETISLTYYADGVLADEMDEPIEDVDDIVGKDSLNHFGEYEDDSVFVRNDRMRCDYEILLDSRKYSDVVKLYRPRGAEE